MEKRLYRSKSDSMIAGVAGGLAEYFSIDPVLVRLLFVLAFFLHGMGVIAYIALWIIAPQKPIDYTVHGASDENEIPSVETPAKKESPEQGREKRTALGAYILIGLGLFFLADNLLPWFEIGNYWPLILIAIGGGILYKSTVKGKHPEDAI